MENSPKESLVDEVKDPLIRYLNKAVVINVKILAVLMVIVIWAVLIDVVVHLYQQFMAPSVTLATVETLISTLGDFLAVLIAIEIFMNIIFYLKKDVIHVPLVLSTALTAISRKVIILDYRTVEPIYVFAIASVILAVGLTYWLVTKKSL